MRRIALLVGIAGLLASAPPASAQDLRAGVGRADITPLQTGYPLGGWVRADRTAQGQHTRLYAKALVLQRGERKVALVVGDLAAIFGGLHQQVAERVASLGFNPENVLIGATHTHSGPWGFANFPTYNSAAPSIETTLAPETYARFFLDPPPADPVLYPFLVERIALAIRRADRDLAPAEAAWGRTELTGVTRNRSLEAHLNNHGVEKPLAEGTPEDDPDGAVHAIDPAVDVLRVDKVRNRRRCAVRRTGGRRVRRCRRVRERVPIGAWSNFANHGTVTKSEFEAYGGDHHASAQRVFEQRVRQAGRVPPGQDVVNVFGNSNEGDISAGLDRTGPAGSDEVGRAEATAMLRAWRLAGRRLSRRPALDYRFTRVCFCGQATEGGNVSDRAVPGLPFLTGSEEGRGPLFEVTRTPYEDLRNPTGGLDSQGNKIPIPAGDFPKAVPLTVVRVGDGLIASMPGEPTKEAGAQVKAAVISAARDSGVRRAVVAGLANEFIQYMTTPQEYDRQHYEGGSTLYGRYELPFLRDRLSELAASLAAGTPAPAPYAFDPTNGVSPDGPSYPAGSEDGRITDQPSPRAARLGHPAIRWRGAPLGRDRPLDEPFVIVERRRGSRWLGADSDLGLAILWRVDSRGRYRAYWEVPLSAPPGSYRFVVNGRRYRLTSEPFDVAAANVVAPREVDAPPGRVAVVLGYPEPRENVDLTARPARATGGRVTFTVGGRRVTVRRRRGSVFSVAAPAGVPVTIGAGDAGDAHGNRSATAFRVR